VGKDKRGRPCDADSDEHQKPNGVVAQSSVNAWLNTPRKKRKYKLAAYT
jgi:hypothetical protein